MSAAERTARAMAEIEAARQGHRRINLRGANLWGANLRGANLRGANLWDANLRGANLRGADLWGADLWGADLWGADLWGADLWGANLRGANLRDANLRDANLRDANRVVLSVTGLPSGQAILTPTPTPDGWTLRVGCWTGTVDELRTLIAGDKWPEAQGDQITVRRPMLAALADMCDAWIADRGDVLDAVIAKWGTTDTEVPA